jgi:hypothetical protein
MAHPAGYPDRFQLSTEIGRDIHLAPEEHAAAVLSGPARKAAFDAARYGSISYAVTTWPMQICNGVANLH